MTGSQSGSVMSVTSTSPSRTRSISAAFFTSRTGPLPMRWPIARPVASTSERSFSRKRRSVSTFSRAFTVSGRACRT